MHAFWKLETTSSQKTSCRKHKCTTASFLATGGFIKLFHKIPWYFHDYKKKFKFHDFSMHGFFLVIFQVFQSLWEPWYSLSCYCINFLPIHTGTISLGFPILYFKGLPVNISIKWCISVHEDFFIIANSLDPDEIPPYATFHLGLHCLPKNLFTGIQNEKDELSSI